MRIFSALFDTILLPLDVAKDLVLEPVKFMELDKSKSETRKRIEKIEDSLSLAAKP